MKHDECPDTSSINFEKTDSSDIPQYLCNLMLLMAIFTRGDQKIKLIITHIPQTVNKDVSQNPNDFDQDSNGDRTPTLSS